MLCESCSVAFPSYYKDIHIKDCKQFGEQPNFTQITYEEYEERKPTILSYNIRDKEFLNLINTCYTKNEEIIQTYENNDNNLTNSNKEDDNIMNMKIEKYYKCNKCGIVMYLYQIDEHCENCKGLKEGEDPNAITFNEVNEKEYKHSEKVEQSESDLIIENEIIRKKEEERKRVEEEKRKIEEEKLRIEEEKKRKEEEERKKKEEEEKRKVEEEKKKIEEEKKRKEEEEERKRKEAEEKKRQEEEEERKRLEEEEELRKKQQCCCVVM